MEQQGLAAQGFRYVRRGSEFRWTHPAEMLPTDHDCSDMTDEEFEAAVLEVTPVVAQ